VEDLRAGDGQSSTWEKRLEEIRRTKVAAIPEEAEALAEALGSGGLGRRIAEDIQMMRGEKMTEEQKQMIPSRPKNGGTLTKLYDIAAKMLKDRDSTVSDQMAVTNLTDEDLQAIVTQATFERIANDPAFRMQVCAELVKAEPQIMQRIIAYQPAEGSDGPVST